MHFKKEVNIPNALTLIRLFLGPLVFYLLIRGQGLPALVLFVLALLTDVVDGYVARRFHIETDFGKHGDRWADKLLYGFVIFGTLLRYGYQNWLWVYGFGVLAFLVTYPLVVRREISVTTGGRFFVFLQGALLIFFILGVVNDLLLGIFALLFIIPAIDYIKTMARKR